MRPINSPPTSRPTSPVMPEHGAATPASAPSPEPSAGAKRTRVQAGLEPLGRPPTRQLQARPAEQPAAAGSAESAQHAWSTANVEGFSYVEVGGKKVLDTTEGLGAFQNLLQLELLKPGTRNLDIGGGSHDDGTNYLKEQGVKSEVFDPFMRSEQHNSEVLAGVKREPVDSVTSNSVLNVIDSDAARKQHISQAHEALKPNGVALFKVWSGDGTQQGLRSETSFQSNRPAASYVGDVASVFGAANVTLNEAHNLIVGKKTDSPA